jgi:hypothetical protein
MVCYYGPFSQKSKSEMAESLALLKAELSALAQVCRTGMRQDAAEAIRVIRRENVPVPERQDFFFVDEGGPNRKRRRITTIRKPSAPAVAPFVGGKIGLLLRLNGTGNRIVLRQSGPGVLVIF